MSYMGYARGGTGENEYTIVAGYIRAVSATSLEVEITIPSDEWWEVLAYFAEIRASAVVAARSGILWVQDVTPAAGVKYYARTRDAVGVAASETGSVFVNPVSGDEQVLEAGVLAAATRTVLPKVIPPGALVTFIVANLQAGDEERVTLVARKHKRTSSLTLGSNPIVP